VKRELRRALLQGRRRPKIFGAGSPTAIRGDGFEFAELREYVAGDDPRRIDWAATARAGELQMRVILEDVALTLAAIVDTSQSMKLGRARSMESAAREGMRTWYDAAETDDRCVRIVGRKVYAPAALRGERSALFCANVAGDEPFALQASLNVAQYALAPGAALLVVSDFYDLTDADEPVLRGLSGRLDCTALIASDPWYEGLPLRGFVTIRDAETGAQRRVFIGKLERRRYSEATIVRASALAKRFEKAGWRSAPLDEKDGARSLYAAFGIAGMPHD